MGLTRKIKKAKGVQQKMGAQGHALPTGLRNFFNAAVKKHQAGHLQEAALLYDKVLALCPDHSDSLNLRGVLASQQGDGVMAEQLLGRAVALRPDIAEYHANLGKALKGQGRLHDAVESFKKAVQANPNDAAVINDLGVAYMDLDLLAEAVPCFNKAIEIRPDDRSFNNFGMLLQMQGDYEDALKFFQKAAAMNPGLVDVRLNIRLNMSKALELLERYDEAEVILRRIVADQPDHTVAARTALSNILRLQDRYEDALAMLKDVLAEEPDNHVAWLSLGTLYSGRGEFDLAAEAIRKAQALKPDSPQNILTMTAITKFDSEHHEEIVKMEKLLQQPTLSSEGQAYLYFSLGKIYDDCGMYEKAFSYYSLGNTIKHRNIKLDRNTSRRQLDSYQAFFTPDFFAHAPRSANTSEVPVFIVGMPRSGTTLTEQIIASHSQAHGAGELRKIGELYRRGARKFGERILNPAFLLHCGSGALTETANEYEFFLQGRGPAGMVRITDKMPFNYMNLGFISLLFPRARVIHCRRNPLDTCLSNYFQHYAEPMSFAYDFEDLGFYYRQYQRLMEHWQSVLPLPMYELDYEELVSNPEEKIRELIGFLGLPWEDSCLNFYASKRGVKTASIWQARQPVYKTSSQRWKNYEKFLGPLKESLGME